MSDSIHHGCMIGLKDEEKEKSSGQDEGIIKTVKCHHFKRGFGRKKVGYGRKYWIFRVKWGFPQ